MSPKQKRVLDVAKWTGVVLGVLTFLGTTGASAHSAFRASLGTKVDTAAYNSDRRVRAVRDSDEHELLLDVLCSRNVDPRNRRCPRR